MQKNGAGLHTASSCYWDNTTDGMWTSREEGEGPQFHLSWENPDHAIWVARVNLSVDGRGQRFVERFCIE